MFRYGEIDDCVGRRRLIVLYSGRTSVNRSRILNYARLYEEGWRRFEALYPHDWEDKAR